MSKSFKELEKKIGHVFSNDKAVATALVHKSFGNESNLGLPTSKRDNEQMEFLGDAVLALAVSELLLEIHPELPEGELSKLRASLVNERSLAGVARILGLGEFVLLGKGEDQTGGRDKDSILSSLLEALLAAIYRDAGFEKAFQWVRTHFREHALKATKEFEGPGLHLQDYKTKLQEVAQAKFKAAPRYNVVSSTGPDHDKVFEIRVVLQEQELAMGSGKSKKEAEQAAARKVFEEYGPDLAKLAKKRK